MKNRNKRNWLTASIVALLAISLSVLPLGQSAPASARDQTLTFLSDIVNLDLPKYNVTLVSDRPPLFGGANQEEIRYLLKNNDNSLDVTCRFNNGTILWCTIYSDSGSPSYTQSQPVNITDKAFSILGRYQRLTGSARFESMKNSLSLANSANDATYIYENSKLTITTDGMYKTFDWVNTYNGIDGPKFSLVFNNGNLETFNDQQSMFTVGNAVAAVTEKQAINIATERAKTFSWKVGTDPSTAQTVTQFNILSEPVQTKLTLQSREGVLCPHWRIDLNLDKTYAGGVSGIQVGIWADTGEINYILEQSYGGAIPSLTMIPTPAQTSEESSTLEPAQILDAKSPPILLIVLAAIIVSLFATTFIIVKRRAK